MFKLAKTAFAPPSMKPLHRETGQGDIDNDYGNQESGMHALEALVNDPCIEFKRRREGGEAKRNQR